ncbi:hypothetical protein IPC103_19660 [Pseudomonas aeruginosa]|nr:hypothetical protein M002_11245 [Pseudomonas aeruginosa ID4365]KSK61400.1 hypothetical protein APA37_23450 [Pseudomonas aeruginosa]RQH63188.1 hypothetical protein IPC103_19660 [Pseudomonas aeruginosa]
MPANKFQAALQIGDRIGCQQITLLRCNLTGFRVDLFTFPAALLRLLGCLLERGLLHHLVSCATVHGLRSSTRKWPSSRVQAHLLGALWGRRDRSHIGDFTSTDSVQTFSLLLTLYLGSGVLVDRGPDLAVRTSLIHWRWECQWRSRLGLPLKVWSTLEGSVRIRQATGRCRLTAMQNRRRPTHGHPGQRSHYHRFIQAAGPVPSQRQVLQNLLRCGLWQFLKEALGDRALYHLPRNALRRHGRQFADQLSWVGTTSEEGIRITDTQFLGQATAGKGKQASQHTSGHRGSRLRRSEQAVISFLADLLCLLTSHHRPFASRAGCHRCQRWSQRPNATTDRAPRQHGRQRLRYGVHDHRRVLYSMQRLVYDAISILKVLLLLFVLIGV